MHCVSSRASNCAISAILYELTTKEITIKTEAQKSNSIINTLKVDSCSSLTGKSTLTYHIGCNTESVMLLHVHANTSGGYFSKE